MQKPDYNFK